ncbi:MAG: protein kinase [Myxococcales bacterium]|nr:protein kinase [Myxococcales bacterium]
MKHTRAGPSNTRSMNPTSSAIGAILGGRYELIRKLGAGGMGEVYEARRRDLGDRVALKLLHEDEGADPELRARFLREARTLAQVASPHVVRIVDFQANPGEVAFLAMEYLQGQNAGELLRLRGPFSAREVLPLAKQMFAGLAAVHMLGLVHRDIKPQNLMIVDGGPLGPILKIVDFGLAKDTSSGERPLTDHATILGTPSYMAPEQVGGNATIDARADIYGAAATFIALATGKTLYEDQGAAVIAAILSGRRLPVAHVAPELGAPLCATLERALASDRNLRHARIEDLAAEVERGLLALGSGAPATFAAGVALDTTATVNDRSRIEAAPAPQAPAPSLGAPFPGAPSLHAPNAAYAPATHAGFGGPAAMGQPAPRASHPSMPGTYPPGSMQPPPSMPYGGAPQGSPPSMQGTYPPGSMQRPPMPGPPPSMPGTYPPGSMQAPPSMHGPPPSMPGTYPPGSMQRPPESFQGTFPPGQLSSGGYPVPTPAASASTSGGKGVVIGVAIGIVAMLGLAAVIVGVFFARTTEDPPDAAASLPKGKSAATPSTALAEPTETSNAAPDPGAATAAPSGRALPAKPGPSNRPSDGGAPPTPSASGSSSPVPPPPVVTGDPTRLPIRCKQDSDCTTESTFCDKAAGLCTCSRGLSHQNAYIYCNGQCVEQTTARCGACNKPCNSPPEVCSTSRSMTGSASIAPS